MGRVGASALAVSVVLASALPATAQVVVNPISGRVSIRAAGQPVSSLLDQMAQKTGMTVEYEKSPPRQSITLTVEDRTPAQAIVAILDGLNIPYALSLTADGAKVQTLVIADTSAPKGTRARVGRETSMAPPPEEAQADVPAPDAPDATAEAPQEQQPQAQAPQPPGPTQRRIPQAPPVTLPSAFPNSPFGPSEGTQTKPEAQPEAPPQPPQAEKEPNV